MKSDTPGRGFSRRLFVGGAALTGATFGAEPPAVPDPTSGGKRERDAYRIRVDAARLERDGAEPDHFDNGDEALYANRMGNFSKGLPHNDLGEVEPRAYDILVHAMHRGTQAAMDEI